MVVMAGTSRRRRSWGQISIRNRAADNHTLFLQIAFGLALVLAAIACDYALTLIIHYGGNL